MNTLIKTKNEDIAFALSELGFPCGFEFVSGVKYFVFVYSDELRKSLNLRFSDADFIFSNKVCF
nr:MAG TPA: hypothetical protein [Caudoviricetes sp.]